MRMTYLRFINGCFKGAEPERAYSMLVTMENEWRVPSGEDYERMFQNFVRYNRGGARPVHRRHEGIAVGEQRRQKIKGGEALAGEEHSEAAVLEDRMEELSAKTKTAVEAGQRDDEEMLRNLLADIQTDAGEKKQKADAVQVKIDDFSNRLKSVEDRTA